MPSFTLRACAMAQSRETGLQTGLAAATLKWSMTLLRSWVFHCMCLFARRPILTTRIPLSPMHGCPSTGAPGSLSRTVGDTGEDLQSQQPEGSGIAAPRTPQEHTEKLGEIQSTLTELQFAGVSGPSPRISGEAQEEAIPADIQAELDKGHALDAECKYAEAATVYEKAVKLAQSAGEKRALIKARIELGETLTREEFNIEKAKDVLSACLVDLKTNPDAKPRSIVLHLLGHIELCQGRIQEGRALCREALDSARARADRFLEALFLIDIAHVEERSGNLPEAHRLLDRAASGLRVEYRESEGK
jgi:hypothetical protein